MQVDRIFISLNAKDFVGLSEWWRTVLGRVWDRQPMPSCHEWDLRDGVLFQVLDNPKDFGRGVVSILIRNLDAEIERLREQGVDAPDPVKVEGFETLRFCQFRDPEGNEVGLLEGA